MHDTWIFEISYNPKKYNIKDYKNTDTVEMVLDDIAKGFRIYGTVYVAFKNKKALKRHIRIFNEFYYSSFSMLKNGKIYARLHPKSKNDKGVPGLIVSLDEAP